jgi:hypothetical protein
MTLSSSAATLVSMAKVVSSGFHERLAGIVSEGRNLLGTGAGGICELDYHAVREFLHPFEINTGDENKPANVSDEITTCVLP